MKGLFIKDIYLMMRNRRYLLLIACIAIALLVMQKEEGIGFVIGYVMVLCLELVLNTFSIDEYDQSITFLMALPTGRSVYVAEKYTFSFACGIIGWLVTVIACMAAWPSQAIDTLKGAALVFVMLTVFQSIVLPVQIKFGGEKGRVILLGGIVLVAAVFYALEEFFNLSEQLVLAVNALAEMGSAVAVLLGLFLCVVCVGISFAVSRYMMEKKEF